MMVPGWSHVALLDWPGTVFACSHTGCMKQEPTAVLPTIFQVMNEPNDVPKLGFQVLANRQIDIMHLDRW